MEIKMKEQAELVREILQPDAEFTPIPFWFFNDAFDEGKVRGQLMDYVEKGVNGIVLHPRIGVPREMPYLSAEYFRAVRYIVGTAAELGMKVVLYDEGMYPSGSAHGMVVEENPEYASKGIILLNAAQAQAKLAAEPGARCITELADGRMIVYGFCGGTIRGIHFGEDDGEAGAPKAADILNPDAVDTFIHLTHDRYYEELKEYFGTTVIAFFTDEPSALGRNAGRYKPWAAGMEKELEAMGGDLRELEGLFVKTGTVAGRADIEETEENETVRLYHRLIKKKLREIFYARLSGWCEKHGIGLMGHPAESDDIEEELYFHIPGQDLIMRRVAPETGGLQEFDSVQAKLSSDIARHLGRRRNANECFGVCCRKGIPWYMTAGDMKWFIDWLGLRGVNLYVPHAFYYSVEGKRKEERPPDVGPNNIWWRYYRRFSDYMKRLSYLMTDSVNGAEIAILCDNNRVPYKEIACLYENQVMFNYLPAALIEEAEVREGRLCIGGYAYKGVLNLLGQDYEERLRGKLGSLLWTITDINTEDAVLQFVSAYQNPQGGRVQAAVETEKPCKNLRAVRLTKKGIELLLLGNEGEEEICIQVRVTGMHNPLFVDLWRGICWRVQETASCVSSCGTAVEGSMTGNCERREQNTESASFRMRLHPRETLLVIDGAEDVIQKVMEGEANVETRNPEWYKEEYPDWTEKFALTQKEHNTAVYSLKYTAEESAKPVRFSVRGDEMVECFCNGVFVDEIGRAHV